MRPQWLEELQDRTLEKLKYRDLNGRFTVGNPGGPGRPTNEVMRAKRVKERNEEIAREEYIISQQPPEFKETLEKAMNGDLIAINKVLRVLR
jgi:hypothetical protein